MRQPPPIEEPNRHYKKRGGKKPYRLERRYVGKTNLALFERLREWHRHSGYKTTKSRQDALRTLTTRGGYHARWEYRIPEDE